MEKVSVLKVRDKDEDQEALAIVRSVNGFVALTLSLEHEGDVQVVFTPSECQELVLRLQQAISDVRGGVLVTGKPSSSGTQNDEVVTSRQEIVEIKPDRGGKVKNG